MSTPSLQTQITALATRLAALDGQGLSNPSTAFVPMTNAAVAGLKTDLVQSTLSLESLLKTITDSISSLWTALSTSLGITPPPADPPETEPPPS